MQPVEEHPTTNTNDTTFAEPADTGDLVAFDRIVDEAFFHTQYLGHFIDVQHLAVRGPRLTVARSDREGAVTLPNFVLMCRASFLVLHTKALTANREIDLPNTHNPAHELNDVGFPDEVAVVRERTHLVS